VTQVRWVFGLPGAANVLLSSRDSQCAGLKWLS
jgi:hypothetical protein